MTSTARFSRWTKLCLALAAAEIGLLAGCGRLPTPPELEGVTEVKAAAIDKFVEAESAAVTRIPVARSSFRAVEMVVPIDEALLAAPISLRFPAGAVVADLVAALDVAALPIVINRDGGMDRRLGDPLSFSSFEGSFGELLDILRRTNGITARQQGRFVMLGSLARYAVDLPQDEGIMSGVSSEIAALGGADIVRSVTGGQVIYRAEPDVHETLINPFLERVADNLAMVTLQVAVVSLAMNDATSRGFDWNAFRLAIDAREGALEAFSGGEGVPGLGQFGFGPLVDLGASAASIGGGFTADLFGRATVLTMGAALNFLSNFGETVINQNVELRTVAGQEVTLRSGQEVPYVSGISTTLQDAQSTGAVETETVQTGLTLTLTPYYDSGTGLVTLGMNLEQRQILQFVELSAGDQIGTITQPLTQDQSLQDLIRVPVGGTVVVGGLQNDNVSLTGTEPAFLRRPDDLEGSPTGGSRTRNIARNAFFIVVRPTVTLFERGGS